MSDNDSRRWPRLVAVALAPAVVFQVLANHPTLRALRWLRLSVVTDSLDYADAVRIFGNEGITAGLRLGAGLGLLCAIWHANDLVRFARQPRTSTLDRKLLTAGALAGAYGLVLLPSSLLAKHDWLDALVFGAKIGLGLGWYLDKQ
jgi:hypothetical protein